MEHQRHQEEHQRSRSTKGSLGFKALGGSLGRPEQYYQLAHIPGLSACSSSPTRNSQPMKVRQRGRNGRTMILNAIRAEKGFRDECGCDIRMIVVAARPGFSAHSIGDGCSAISLRLSRGLGLLALLVPFPTVLDLVGACSLSISLIWSAMMTTLVHTATSNGLL